MMYSQQYKIKILEGKTEILTANIIEEYLFSQVDQEIHQQSMMYDI